MTEQSLNRAKEIEIEKAGLQSSLAELLKNRIFSIESGGCGSYRSSADPFLAELEIDTRSFAASRITARIKKLEAEFKTL